MYAPLSARRTPEDPRYGAHDRRQDDRLPPRDEHVSVSDTSVLIELLEQCRRDHAAWINGDGSSYALPEDGTILGAVGGYSRGGRDTSERQKGVAAQWRSGTGDVELVNGGVSGDVAWLVMIERATVSFTSDIAGTERRWDLRVTEIFRRSENEWVRVHRHADPLVERRPLDEIGQLLA